MWRKPFIGILITGALALTSTMAAGLIACSKDMEAPPTAVKAATLACQTTQLEHQLGLGVVTGYELPNVGKPKAIIVEPTCRKVSALPKTDPSYYSRRVNVYLMVSAAQLHKLLGNDYEMLDYDHPYMLDGPALKHLISSELRNEIDSDPTYVRVTYMVTSGPMPTTPTAQKGYEMMILPYDARTGVRYDHLPFTTAKAFDAGSPIIIGGDRGKDKAV
jgi:hypothetical protein